MENSFQTSFIPKKPVTTDITRKPSKSLFSLLSIFLLIIMGVATAGLYLYKSYLIKQKEVLSSSLGKVRDSFEKDTINELELYDKRVSAAKQVLGGHIVLSPMFALLGNLTIPSVQYTKFDHQTTSQGFFVKMSGMARDYRSIALQADVFNTSKGRSFKNVVFSNLVKDKNNFILFDLEFIVDPGLLSYEKNILLEKAQAKIEAEVPSTEVIPEGQATEVQEAPSLGVPPVEVNIPNQQ